MALSNLWDWLENLPMAQDIAASWGFPMAESLHVVGATFVLGSILMLDLRLLGLAARRYPVSQIVREIVPWTIGGFTLSVVAGFFLFITQPNRYVGNRAFQIKFVLLILAVANMLYFHFRTRRSIAEWDTTETTSGAARLAGASSLVLWIGVMLAGRWIGHLLG
jgi:hypothetical protein